MEHLLYLSHLHLSVSHCGLLKSLLIPRKTIPSPQELFEILQICSERVRNFPQPSRLEVDVGASLKALKKNPWISVVHFWSEDYPPLLRAIKNPPWVLFIKGFLPPPKLPLVAVVGSRKPSQYGIDVLHGILTPALKERTFGIVSGLAYGIDSMAHKIACSENIPNYGVLGSGLINIYPSSHDTLAAEILEQGGALISEFPPLAKGHPHHFPWRNRIISGLSHIVWVVQGTQSSGSKHTASYAQEQGKYLVATPCDIFSPLGETPLNLLREGATPLITSQDLVTVIPQYL